MSIANVSLLGGRFFWFIFFGQYDNRLHVGALDISDEHSSSTCECVQCHGLFEPTTAVPPAWTFTKGASTKIFERGRFQNNPLESRRKPMVGTVERTSYKTMDDP